MTDLRFRRGRELARAMAAVGLFVATATHAEPRVQRGVQELAIHLSPDFEGAVGDMISADLSYALFVRDRLSLRGVAAYRVLEDVAGNDSDYRLRAFDLVAEYHFELERALVPNVGVGLGWIRTEFGDTVESGATYGPRAGLKYFLADNVAVDFEVTYKLSSADAFVNDFVREDTDLATAVGLRVSF